jgi:alkylated DNA repair protein (DNA oxidative demethylase)
VFLFGGLKRATRAVRVPVTHGDVVVWGGPARLSYHGVLTLADGLHPLTGRCRFNLSFRRAG